MQGTVAAGEYEPTAQATQIVDEVAPVVFEYAPAMQVTQAELFVTSM